METSTLLDATRALLASTHSGTAEHDVRVALAECEDAGLLDRALALDPFDELPIALKWAMFERRLQVGPREAAVLRQFADHLWLHGPGRDAEVAALRREADS